MKQVIAIFALILSTTGVFAHSDKAHHPVSEKTAFSIAGNLARSFTNTDLGLGFGKLPSNWAVLPPASTKLFKRGAGYMIISVFNAAEKKTLYVLMSEEGRVYDANFTGEFKGLMTQAAATTKP